MIIKKFNKDKEEIKTNTPKLPVIKTNWKKKVKSLIHSTKQKDDHTNGREG